MVMVQNNVRETVRMFNKINRLVLCNVTNPITATTIINTTLQPCFITLCGSFSRRYKYTNVAALYIISESLRDKQRPKFALSLFPCHPILDRAVIGGDVNNDIITRMVFSHSI